MAGPSGAKALMFIGSGGTAEAVPYQHLCSVFAIHKNCFETAEKYGTPGNLVNGANIAGFLKVANSMLDQGLV